MPLRCRGTNMAVGKIAPNSKPPIFYPEKASDRWWLVGPVGNLFRSYGPTGVRAGGEGGPVRGKESWFDEFPSPDGAFAQY